MGIFAALETFINTLLTALGSWGAILGCIFILFESIIPPLPLSVFITLNFLTFGNLVGFIISWIFTCIGCMMSYYLFKKSIKEKYLNKLKERELLGKIINVIENMDFKNLVLLIAIPFTPAFLINIAAGICRIDAKKYFYALLIGKISLVYFWGYIGVSLIDSLKNPMILIKVGVALIIMYILSMLVSKKLKIR